MIVILLWFTAQRIAGCAPAEGEEGAGRPCAAWLDVQLQDGSQSQSCMESRISSGGGQGLVESRHSMSPVHSAQAPWHHVRMEGAAWGTPPSPMLSRPRAAAVGSLLPTVKQVVGFGFQNLSLPEPCSVCMALT